jgi:hypothetical protein
VNSVCSSAAGAAAPAAAAAAATGAAAVTPNYSTIIFTRSTTSMIVMFEIDSRICSWLAAIAISPEIKFLNPNQLAVPGVTRPWWP